MSARRSPGAHRSTLFTHRTPGLSCPTNVRNRPDQRQSPPDRASDEYLAGTEVDDLFGLGQLHRILAQVEVSYSNSMIEATGGR